MWSGRTNCCLKERNRKSLRHHWLPMIFDHLHWIPEATHVLWLCCQDVMSGGSVSFNYSHFNSIYTSAAKSFVRKNSLFLRFLRQGKTCFFFWPPFYTTPSVFLQRQRATTSHLVCCCIKLWHQPGLIVSRPGAGCVSILFFPFLCQGLSCSGSSKTRLSKKVHDVM